MGAWLCLLFVCFTCTGMAWSAVDDKAGADSVMEETPVAEASAAVTSNGKPSTIKTTLRLAASDGTAHFMQHVLQKVHTAFLELGIETQRVALPSRRGPSVAAIGEVDGLYLRLLELGDQYPSLVRIEVPVYQGEAWIWVHGDNECPASTGVLQSMNTASVLGYPAYDRVPEIFNSPKIKVLSVAQAFKLLQAKRIDFLAAYSFAGQFYQDSLGVSLKRCFSKPIAYFNYYSYLHESHKHLIPKVEMAYRKVFGDFGAAMSVTAPR